VITAPGAAAGYRQTHGDHLAIRSGHGVAVDVEIAGERTDRRQGIAGLEISHRDKVANGFGDRCRRGTADLTLHINRLSSRARTRRGAACLKTLTWMMYWTGRESRMRCLLCDRTTELCSSRSTDWSQARATRRVKLAEGGRSVCPAD
jgi:hypothetical protein